NRRGDRDGLRRFLARLLRRRAEFEVFPRRDARHEDLGVRTTDAADAPGEPVCGARHVERIWSARNATRAARREAAESAGKGAERGAPIAAEWDRRELERDAGDRAGELIERELSLHRHVDDLGTDRAKALGEQAVLLADLFELFVPLRRFPCRGFRPHRDALQVLRVRLEIDARCRIGWS